MFLRCDLTFSISGTSEAYCSLNVFSIKSRLCWMTIIWKFLIQKWGLSTHAFETTALLSMKQKKFWLKSREKCMNCQPPYTFFWGPFVCRFFKVNAKWCMNNHIYDHPINGSRTVSSSSWNHQTLFITLTSHFVLQVL